MEIGPRAATVVDPVERRLQAGLVAVAILLAGGAALAVVTSLRALEDARLVSHTHEVLTATGALLQAAVNSETGARGYTITGDEAFLEPQLTAGADAAAALARLRVLTADNPVQQARLVRLEELIDRRLRLSLDAIAMRRRGGFEGGASVTRTKEGKAATDAIRGLTGEMADEERRLLATRGDDALAAARHSSLALGILVVLVVLILAFLLLGYSWLRRDIAARRRSERELRLARDAMEVSNRELDAFSHSVSHDLRAPLRGIHGFSQAILEDNAGKFDAETTANFGRVQAAAKRMGRLVDDMLMLSRITRAEMVRRPVDLSALAVLVAGEIRQADPLRQVDVRIGPGLEAEGDPALLRIALENLLGNAWKFTSRTPGASIEFGMSEGEGERRFFVRDNGAGFDMAHAGKLFGVFQRLHRESEFPGTGVGLATVARVIQRHGGRIWAEAAPGRGAAFWFTLAAGRDKGGSHGEQAADPAGR